MSESVKFLRSPESDNPLLGLVYFPETGKSQGSIIGFLQSVIDIKQLSNICFIYEFTNRVKWSPADSKVQWLFSYSAASSL